MSNSISLNTEYRLNAIYSAVYALSSVNEMCDFFWHGFLLKSAFNLYLPKFHPYTNRWLHMCVWVEKHSLPKNPYLKTQNSRSTDSFPSLVLFFSRIGTTKNRSDINLRENADNISIIQYTFRIQPSTILCRCSSVSFISISFAFPSSDSTRLQIYNEQWYSSEKSYSANSNCPCWLHFRQECGTGKVFHCVCVCVRQVC